MTPMTIRHVHGLLSPIASSDKQAENDKVAAAGRGYVEQNEQILSAEKASSRSAHWKICEAKMNSSDLCMSINRHIVKQAFKPLSFLA